MANRQHRSVDPQAAIAHLHAIAREPDHALDVGLARIARQAEHHHVAARRQPPEQPLRPRRAEPERHRIAAVAVGELRHHQLVADQQSRLHGARRHIIGFRRHRLGEHHDSEDERELPDIRQKAAGGGLLLVHGR